MDRRDFIAATAALLVSPQRSWAQGTPRRVGYLDFAPLYLPLYKVWQDSMRDHDRIEGKNLIVDYRSAEGHAERVAPLALQSPGTTTSLPRCVISAKLPDRTCVRISFYLGEAP
jgi:hypothetical protein